MTTLLLPVPQPDQLLLEIPIFTRINPLERPRLNFMSKHIYQPLENQKALLAEMFTHKQTQSIYAATAIEILIYHSAMSSMLKSPAIAKDLGDIDNQAKAVLDALVKAHILVDDKQVVSLHVTRAYDVEDFCLIRVWSVDPQPETTSWDSSTAHTNLTPLKAAPTPSADAPRPSPSSRPARGKPKS